METNNENKKTLNNSTENSNLKKIIAKNLVDLRKEFKYTQSDIAEYLNYSDKAISKWEKGDSLPDIEILYKLCNLYGVTLDYLTHEGSWMDKPEFRLPEKKTVRNKIMVTLMFNILIWFIAVLVFVFGLIYKNHYLWPAFIWAIPGSAIVCTVFNGIWGKKVFILPCTSVINWGFITAIYLQLLYYGHNFWPLFIICIPIQVALVLWQQIK